MCSLPLWLVTSVPPAPICNASLPCQLTSLKPCMILQQLHIGKGLLHGMSQPSTPETPSTVLKWKAQPLQDVLLDVMEFASAGNTAGRWSLFFLLSCLPYCQHSCFPASNQSLTASSHLLDKKKIISTLATFVLIIFDSTPCICLFHIYPPTAELRPYSPHIKTLQIGAKNLLKAEIIVNISKRVHFIFQSIFLCIYLM